MHFTGTPGVRDFQAGAIVIYIYIHSGLVPTSHQISTVPRGQESGPGGFEGASF